MHIRHCTAKLIKPSHDHSFYELLAFFAKSAKALLKVTTFAESHQQAKSAASQITWIREGA
jgi:hypothetical protein